MTDNQKKQAVFLVYPCFLCTVHFDNEDTNLAHMNDTHGYYIPSRTVGVPRPLDENFSFENHSTNTNQRRYGCAACWFHCEMGNMRALRLHTINAHPYGGHDDSASDNDNDQAAVAKNSPPSTVQNSEQQKKELLIHILAELDNLHQFFKGIMY
ncbi:hypothetical protein INT47_006108 [Mucor saturninus]|uniref:C2H2-type domain-containing protein n=1 Tax=Mucor saturninus TaxID=64648 RepID=A0A8H7V9E8_9FUNG|nr:hypothetical protein INT47_006108 [Mucor saturninus]